jgi:hypothetical protein
MSQEATCWHAWNRDNGLRSRTAADVVLDSGGVGTCAIDANVSNLTWGRSICPRVNYYAEKLDFHQAALGKWELNTLAVSQRITRVLMPALR